MGRACVAIFVLLLACGGPADSEAPLCVPRAPVAADQYCVSASMTGEESTSRPKASVRCEASDLFLFGNCAPTQHLTATTTVYLDYDAPLTESGRPIGWSCEWWSPESVNSSYFGRLTAYVCCQKPVAQCLPQE